MYYSVIYHVSRVVKVFAMGVITSDSTMISPVDKNTFEPAKTTTLHVNKTNLERNKQTRLLSFILLVLAQQQQKTNII